MTDVGQKCSIYSNHILDFIFEDRCASVVDKTDFDYIPPITAFSNSFVPTKRHSKRLNRPKSSDSFFERENSQIQVDGGHSSRSDCSNCTKKMKLSVKQSEPCSSASVLKSAERLQSDPKINNAQCVVLLEQNAPNLVEMETEVVKKKRGRRPKTICCTPASTPVEANKRKRPYKRKLDRPHNIQYIPLGAKTETCKNEVPKMLSEQQLNKDIPKEENSNLYLPVSNSKTPICILKKKVCTKSNKPDNSDIIYSSSIRNIEGKHVPKIVLVKERTNKIIAIQNNDDTTELHIEEVNTSSTNSNSNSNDNIKPEVGKHNLPMRISERVRSIAEPLRPQPPATFVPNMNESQPKPNETKLNYVRQLNARQTQNVKEDNVKTQKVELANPIVLYRNVVDTSNDVPEDLSIKSTRNTQDQNIKPTNISTSRNSQALFSSEKDRVLPSAPFPSRKYFDQSPLQQQQQVLQQSAHQLIEAHQISPIQKSYIQSPQQASQPIYLQTVRQHYPLRSPIRPPIQPYLQTPQHSPIIQHQHSPLQQMQPQYINAPTYQQRMQYMMQQQAANSMGRQGQLGNPMVRQQQQQQPQVMTQQEQQQLLIQLMMQQQYPAMQQLINEQQRMVQPLQHPINQQMVQQQMAELQQQRFSPQQQHLLAQQAMKRQNEGNILIGNLQPDNLRRYPYVSGVPYAPYPREIRKAPINSPGNQYSSDNSQEYWYNLPNVNTYPANLQNKNVSNMPEVFETNLFPNKVNPKKRNVRIAKGPNKLILEEPASKVKRPNVHPDFAQDFSNNNLNYKSVFSNEERLNGTETSHNMHPTNDVATISMSCSKNVSPSNVEGPKAPPPYGASRTSPQTGRNREIFENMIPQKYLNTNPYVESTPHFSVAQDVRNKLNEFGEYFLNNTEVTIRKVKANENCRSTTLPPLSSASIYNAQNCSNKISSGGPVGERNMLRTALSSNKSEPNKVNNHTLNGLSEEDVVQNKVSPVACVPEDMEEVYQSYISKEIDPLVTTLSNANKRKLFQLSYLMSKRPRIDYTPIEGNQQIIVKNDIAATGCVVTDKNDTIEEAEKNESIIKIITSERESSTKENCVGDATGKRQDLPISTIDGKGINVEDLPITREDCVVDLSISHQKSDEATLKTVQEVVLEEDLPITRGDCVVDLSTSQQKSDEATLDTVEELVVLPTNISKPILTPIISEENETDSVISREKNDEEILNTAEELNVLPSDIPIETPISPQTLPQENETDLAITQKSDEATLTTTEELNVLPTDIPIETPISHETLSQENETDLAISQESDEATLTTTEELNVLPTDTPIIQTPISTQMLPKLTEIDDNHNVVEEKEDGSSSPKLTCEEELTSLEEVLSNTEIIQTNKTEPEKPSSNSSPSLSETAQELSLALSDQDLEHSISSKLDDQGSSASNHSEELDTEIDDGIEKIISDPVVNDEESGQLKIVEEIVTVIDAQQTDPPNEILTTTENEKPHEELEHEKTDKSCENVLEEPASQELVMEESTAEEDVVSIDLCEDVATELATKNHETKLTEDLNAVIEIEDDDVYENNCVGQNFVISRDIESMNVVEVTITEDATSEPPPQSIIACYPVESSGESADESSDDTDDDDGDNLSEGDPGQYDVIIISSDTESEPEFVGESIADDNFRDDLHKKQQKKVFIKRMKKAARKKRKSFELAKFIANCFDLSVGTDDSGEINKSGDRASFPSTVPINAISSRNISAQTISENRIHEGNINRTVLSQFRYNKSLWKRNSKIFLKRCLDIQLFKFNISIPEAIVCLKFMIRNISTFVIPLPEAQFRFMLECKDVIEDFYIHKYFQTLYTPKADDSMVIVRLDESDSESSMEVVTISSRTSICTETLHQEEEEMEEDGKKENDSSPMGNSILAIQRRGDIEGIDENMGSNLEEKSSNEIEVLENDPGMDCILSKPSDETQESTTSNLRIHDMEEGDSDFEKATDFCCSEEDITEDPDVLKIIENAKEDIMNNNASNICCKILAENTDFQSENEQITEGLQISKQVKMKKRFHNKKYKEKPNEIDNYESFSDKENDVENENRVNEIKSVDSNLNNESEESQKEVKILHNQTSNANIGEVNVVPNTSWKKANDAPPQIEATGNEKGPEQLAAKILDVSVESNQNVVLKNSHQYNNSFEFFEDELRNCLENGSTKSVICANNREEVANSDAFSTSSNIFEDCKFFNIQLCRSLSIPKSLFQFNAMNLKDLYKENNKITILSKVVLEPKPKEILKNYLGSANRNSQENAQIELHKEKVVDERGSDQNIGREVVHKNVVACVKPSQNNFVSKQREDLVKPPGGAVELEQRRFQHPIPLFNSRAVDYPNSVPQPPIPTTTKPVLPQQRPNFYYQNYPPNNVQHSQNFQNYPNPQFKLPNQPILHQSAPSTSFPPNCPPIQSNLGIPNNSQLLAPVPPHVGMHHTKHNATASYNKEVDHSNEIRSQQPKKSNKCYPRTKIPTNPNNLSENRYNYYQKAPQSVPESKAMAASSSWNNSMETNNQNNSYPDQNHFPNVVAPFNRNHPPQNMVFQKMQFLLSILHRGDILSPEEYVREIQILNYHQCPRILLDFYTFITKSQIYVNVFPISFRLFLEYHCAGKLKDLEAAFVRYVESHERERQQRLKKM